MLVTIFCVIIQLPKKNVFVKFKLINSLVPKEKIERNLTFVTRKKNHIFTEMNKNKTCINEPNSSLSKTH